MAGTGGNIASVAGQLRQSLIKIVRPRQILKMPNLANSDSRSASFIQLDSAKGNFEPGFDSTSVLGSLELFSTLVTACKTEPPYAITELTKLYEMIKH